MTEEIKDPIHPVEAINAGPQVLSDLLESDDLLAAEILTLIGSTEHYRNDRLRTRRQFSLGLEDNAEMGFFMKLLDGLIKFLVRMGDDLLNGALGINLNLNKIINRAEQINTASRSNRRVNKTGTFKIDTRIQNLSINYRPINDPQRLMMYLKSVDGLMRRYFKYQDEQLLTIIPGIMSLRPDTPDAVETLTNLLNNVSPVNFAKASGFNEGEYRMTGPHMLGNQQLTVINKNPTGDATERLIGQEFLLQPSDSEPKVPPEYIEYDVFAKTIEQSILRQVILTATELVNRTGMYARNRRRGRSNDLVKYLDQIRKDVASGKYQDADLTTASTFILLLEAFNNWLVNPYLSLLALMCRNMSAVLNMCEANN